jgi:hypothetical protein
MKQIIGLSICLLVAVSCAHKNKTNAPTAGSPVEATTAPTKNSSKTQEAKTQEAKTQEAKTQAATPSGASVNCTNKNETRTIAIVAKDPGCETVYSKGGNVQSIANAKSDLSYCDKKLNQVKSNLEKAGWVCQ